MVLLLFAYSYNFEITVMGAPIWQKVFIREGPEYNYNNTNLDRKGGGLRSLDKRRLFRSKQLVHSYFYPELQLADFVILSQEKIEIGKTAF